MKLWLHAHKYILNPNLPKNNNVSDASSSKMAKLISYEPFRWFSVIYYHGVYVGAQLGVQQQQPVDLFV